MRYFRLIVGFLCLASLGTAIGYLFILHKGTWMLHWFAVFLVILAVTFTPARWLATAVFVAARWLAFVRWPVATLAVPHGAGGRMLIFRLVIGFLCLASLGIAIGHLFFTHSGTWMLHWFALFLVILAVTFIPVRWFAFVGARVGHGAAVAAPYVGGWFRNSVDALGRNVRAFAGWIWSIVRGAPSLFWGLLFVSLAILMIIHGYTNERVGEFHLGMFLVIIAVLLFINQFGLMRSTGRFIKGHPVGIWLVASVTSLAIALGHKWGLYPVGLSAVSTVLAAIVFFGWTGAVKRKIGAGTTFVFNRILKLLTGGYGYGPMFMTYAIITFVILAPSVMKNNPLEKQQADWVYSVGMAFVFALILGVIFTGEELFKKKKK